MTRRHLALGEAGEEMAVNFLTKKGLRILERRVRCRHGEIDIVAREGGEWVFVEVKTRRGNQMGDAVSGMTRHKIKCMSRAVLEYMTRHGLENQPIRLDLVAIDFNADDVPEISHYPAGIEMRL